LLERALRIEEAQFGPDHPQVATTLNNLGVVWGDLGQPAKALEVFERALRILEGAYGPDHPQVAATLSNLGAVWSNLGQPAKAHEVFERALRILHAHFPSGHPLTDEVADNLRRVAPDVIVLDDGQIVRLIDRSPPDTPDMS
jgi:Tfp pilus assembly protein PilF